MHALHWLVAFVCVVLSACTTISPLSSASPLPAPDVREANVTEVTRPIELTLGLVTSANFVVIDVEAGSGAAMAHVQVGDQLLALDELVLRDANSVAEAKAKIAPGQSMRLILLRESRRMEVLIVPQAPNAFPNKATQTPVPPNALYL